MKPPAWQKTHRFTADEVLKMIEYGILSEPEKLELLDGALVVKDGQGPYHAARSAHLAMELGRIYRGVGHIRNHSPVYADDYNLPEPDVVVVRGHPQDYLRSHPTGANVIFAIELSEMTRPRDRAKIRICGGGHVPEYWLADFRKRHVEVRSNPGASGIYRDLAIYGPDDEILLPERSEKLPARLLLP